jgi:hypothetical protein
MLAVIVLITNIISRIAFSALYIIAVVMAYNARGIVWAIIAAIPMIGQMLWFGVMWGDRGFFNFYTGIAAVGIGLYLLGGYLLGRADKGTE